MAKIYGVELSDLPKNLRATEVVAIVRCVDLTEGTPMSAALCIRVSDGVPTWELLGMLTGLAADTSRDFLEALQPSRVDGDESA